MLARLMGAGLYGVAAATASLAAVLGPDLAVDAIDGAGLRAAAVATALGALLGFFVVTAWPRRTDVAIVSAILTALVGLVFFCGAFLIVNALATAIAGGSAADAVTQTVAGIAEGLPIAAPLALGAFAVAGLLLRIFAGVGRRFGRTS